MAIFSAIAAAVTAIGGFIGGLGAIGTFVLKTVVGIGLNLLASAIAGKPEGPTFGIQGKIQSGGDVPRSILFGYTATAGSLVYANTWGKSGKTPNAYLTQVIALSDIPVNGLVEFWVNGEKCTIDYNDTSYGDWGFPVEEYQLKDGNHLWVKFYDGTQTTADPFLVNTVSSAQRPYESTRVGRGVAYAIVTAQINEELFTGFPSFKFALNGAKLYDISKDSTKGGSGTQREDDPSTWGGDGDHLPAVQIYNLLRGINYGGEWFYGLQNMSAARLPAAAWIAQINKCRAQIQGPNGLEPTYRTGGEIQVSAPIADAVEAMLMGCQGRLSEIGGVYKVHVGEPGTPVATFTDDEILSSEEQSFTPFFGLADTINGIAAKYPNPEEGWNVKVAPPLYRTDLEVLAGNRRLMSDVSLDLVPYKGQVQRLMRSALLEAQRARRHTFVLPPAYWLLEPGDIISWTSERNGYVTKLFRVDGVADKANLDVMVDITEVDPSDYDWDQETDYKEPVDGPVGPVRPPPLQMIGWQVAPATIGEGDTALPSIQVIFEGDLEDVSDVRVQVRLAATAEIVFDGEIPYGDPLLNPNPHSVILNGQFLPNTAYQVRGIFIRPSDQASEWSAWLPVTTPNIWVKWSPYPIDLDDLNEDIAGYLDWIGGSSREVERRLEEIELWLADQDFGNEYDRQQIRVQLTATFESARADYTQKIDVLAAADLALAARTTTLEAEISNVQGDVTALTSDVTSLQSTVTTQGGQIAGNSSAISSLSAEVTSLDGQVTSNAQAITNLQAEVDGIASSVSIRAEAQSSPGGGWARFGVQVNVDGQGDWSTASFFLDTNGSLSRAVFVADQFIITDGTNTQSPFLFTGGAAYLNVANIGTITAGTIKSPDNKFIINVAAGSLEWFE